MTARSQFIWVLSSAWQEVVQNMLRIGWNVFEQSVIGVLSKLWRSGISVTIQVEPNCASYVCFNPTFIWWGCKAPPGWRSVEELGEHHRLVNVFSASLLIPWQRMIFNACRVWAHLLMTSRTWSLTDRWLVSVTPSIRIDVARRISGNSGGRHGCSLRLLSVKMTSTVLARLSFKLLAWAHSATSSSSSALDWTLQAGITT